MRRLGIFLDSSAAMSNEKSDFKPTSLLFSIRLLEAFIPDFLRRNTLGSASVFELRDGICQQIAPVVGKWSANPHQIVGDIQHRFQQKSAALGSGTASVVNALRVMCCELGAEGGAHGHQVNKSNNTNNNLSSSLSGFSGHCSSSALLITSAITLVDAADVFASIDQVVKLGIKVDVLSLCGAPHVLETLCQRTGGQLLCPVVPSQSLGMILQIAQPTWILSKNNNVNGVRRDRNENSDDVVDGEKMKGGSSSSKSKDSRMSMTPVALYHDANAGVPSQCPLCKSPQEFRGFPRSCVSCGLLSLSEVQWRTSRAEASSSRIVAISHNNNNNHHVSCRGICGAGPNSASCVSSKTIYVDDDEQQSHSHVSDGANSGNQAKTVYFTLRCLNCRAPFCSGCARLFSGTVKMCPCCAVMLEDI